MVVLQQGAERPLVVAQISVGEDNSNGTGQANEPLSFMQVTEARASGNRW
jgi:hypothetical protein